jgi:hypothetical protein
LGISCALCRRSRASCRHPAGRPRRANATTLREHVLRMAERAEAELAEERSCFIDGCPTEWAALPIPDGRIAVGLDGGYVRNWEDRKTNFEIIVSRSVPEDREARYIGLVHGYDSKPKRRLFEVLKSQGLQANQDVTFLTDGGEEVRALTELVTPGSEHVLDWFHITMRVTSWNNMPEAALTTMRRRAPACWMNWNGSNGCSGTATSIALKRRSHRWRMMWTGWRSTT